MFATNAMSHPSSQTNQSNGIISAEPEQMSAVQYRFRVEGRRMFGMLISTYSSGHSRTTLGTTNSDLQDELDLWDTLSDDALLDFEDSIA